MCYTCPLTSLHISPAFQKRQKFLDWVGFAFCQDHRLSALILTIEVHSVHVPDPSATIRDNYSY